MLRSESWTNSNATEPKRERNIMEKREMLINYTTVAAKVTDGGDKL